MKRLLLALVLLLTACSLPPTATPPVPPPVEQAYGEALASLRVVIPSFESPNLVPREGELASYMLFHGGHNVIYSRSECENVRDVYGFAAVFGVFGHELGHVIDSSAILSGELTYVEAQLSADAWAGCALAIRGFDVAPFAALLAAEETENAAIRTDATEQGFKSCAEIW